MVDGYFNASATTGYTLDFTSGTYGSTDPITYLSVTPKGECYIQPVYTGGTLTTPQASPAAGSNAGAKWFHLAAGDNYEKDLARGFSANNQGRAIIGLNVYSVDAAELLFEGC